MTLLEKEKLYCSQGDTSGKHNPKKVFAESVGSFLIDSDGNQFLDMQMFNSAANFGYRNSCYTETLEKKLNVLPCLAGEFMSEDRIILSEKICTYMYANYGVKGRVHFTVGGAQAVDDALKLAINYNGKRNFIAFEGAYHGRTMAASSVSSSYRYTRQFGSVINTLRVPFPNCTSCAYAKDDETCELYCLQQFNRMFQSEFSGVFDTTAGMSAYSAFIFEPVLGRGGYVFPNPVYLQNMVKTLRKHNILAIADEVQMGFFRTGKQWSFEHYGIVPDIVIFGKAITNGIWPLSGVWAREDIISPQRWPTGSTHCTFAGHPLAMALGLCTLDLVEKPSFLDAIQKSSSELMNCFSSIAEDYSAIGRFQGKGHAIGIDIINPNTKEPDPELAHRLVDMALMHPISVNGQQYGLILTAGGMYNSQLMFSPNLFISTNEIHLFENLFRQFLDLSLKQ